MGDKAGGICVLAEGRSFTDPGRKARPCWQLPTPASPDSPGRRPYLSCLFPAASWVPAGSGFSALEMHLLCWSTHCTPGTSLRTVRIIALPVGMERHGHCILWVPGGLVRRRAIPDVHPWPRVVGLHPPNLCPHPDSPVLADAALLGNRVSVDVSKLHEFLPGYGGHNHNR